MSELFSRRGFLKLSGAAALTAVLSACGGGGGGGVHVSGGNDSNEKPGGNGNDNTGGDTGNGGSTGGGGASSRKYYDVGDGLQFKDYVYTTIPNSSYDAEPIYPKIVLSIKNTSPEARTILPEQFISQNGEAGYITFDNADYPVAGFNKDKNWDLTQFVTIEPDTEKSVAVYIERKLNSIPHQEWPVYFSYSHDGGTHKVICSGVFSTLPLDIK